MTQAERRLYLINALLAERPSCRRQPIPQDAQGQKRLLRGLLNVRPPKAIAPEFLDVQDAYLREELAEGGITRVEELTPAAGGALPLAGRYYAPGLRRDRQRREQRPDGLLCAEPRLHRQLHPYLRGCPAAAGLRRTDGPAEARGADRTGEDHAGV